MNKRMLFLFCAFLLVVAMFLTFLGNVSLELNSYTISDSDLPATFDGYRVAHISDLHNTQMGKNNEDLLEMLREARPDIIAITGDLIDSRKTDVTVALDFAEEAMKIAPCYYVAGNHEARIPEYEQFKKELAALGVMVLENDSLEIERSGEKIALVGVNDPSFVTDPLQDDATVMSEILKSLVRDDLYTILLSHRPELFETYVKSGANLVLSGHAHGGQFRLPLVGGLFAPHQGFFPQYDAGLFTEQNTNMIVSRGIDNSRFPFRVNNSPEVILIMLRKG